MRETHEGWQVQHLVDPENDLWRNSCVLPRALSRFTRGDGLIYLLDTGNLIGETYAAPATELKKGEAWVKCGGPASVAGDVTKLWLEVTNDELPVAPLFRPVTEGWPALAPRDRIAPAPGDPDRARRGWAWIAERLAPAGRLMIGASLTAPWTEPAGGTPSVISLWGENGEGKSLAAEVAAAVWQDPKEQDLLMPMNAAAQGLSAAAQELGWMPILLDEAQSATVEIEAQLIALVMGAKRARANRSGTRARNAGRFGSLIFTTSNARVDVQHEMWARRLIAVTADRLWADVPGKEQPDERAHYWAQIADALPLIAGHPWHELSKTFGPGPDARDLLTVIRSVPMPGEGNIGMILRNALVGCRWLAEWTGQDAWTAGTGEAAALIVEETREDAPDPIRDAARRLLSSHAVDGDRWNGAAPGETWGWMEQAVTWPSCAVAHDDPTECVWLNVAHDRLAPIVLVDPRRLARTVWAKITYSPEPGHLSRKTSDGRNRSRVYTVCLSGAMVLADGTDRAKVTEAPAWDPGQIKITPPARTPAPVVTEQRPSKVEPLVTATRDEDLIGALDRAIEQGATEIVGPWTWTPETLDGSGWDRNHWAGDMPSAVVKRDGTAIRVWRDDEPEARAVQLAGWYETTGQTGWASESGLAVRMVMDAAKAGTARHPRWQLPTEQAELWTPGTIMHARQWGDRGATGNQWDRVASYLPAYRQANIAPLWQGEAFETLTGSAVPAPSAQQAGMWEIEIPPWHMPTPPPHGMHEPGTTTWVSTEIMRLYHEHGVEPTVIRAVLAPVHKVAALHSFGEQVDRWLTELPDPERGIAKGLYQRLAGSMMSERSKGARNRIYRPDWSAAIMDNSWANTLRRVYATYAATGWVPQRVNVDAIYYAEDGEPHGLPIGERPGSFRAVKDGE